VARYSGIFGFGRQEQGGFAESTMIRWGYEGLPNNGTTAFYTYQFFYEDQDGQMVDVSNFTNFTVETFPGSGEYKRLEPKTTIIEIQPYTTQYVVTDEMMALGIDWCETIPLGVEHP